MHVTKLEQVATGHWVMEVEREVILRQGVLGFRAATAKRREQFASQDGFSWVHAVTGDRVPADIETEFERMFDHEVEIRGLDAGMAPAL